MAGGPEADPRDRRAHPNLLSVLDVHTRECLAGVARRSFRGVEVAGILSGLGDERTLPDRISVDNGTKFTSKALDHWAY